jgi:hypothetical protein
MELDDKIGSSKRLEDVLIGLTTHAQRIRLFDWLTSSISRASTTSDGNHHPETSSGSDTSHPTNPALTQPILMPDNPVLEHYLRGKKVALLYEKKEASQQRPQIKHNLELFKNDPFIHSLFYFVDCSFFVNKHG